MPQVKHIVLMEMKADTTDQQVSDLFAALSSLREKIPGLTDYCGGPYSSPEGFNRGFTHGFIMTFESIEARDGYITHPEHVKAADVMLPLVENTVAFDFEV